MEHLLDPALKLYPELEVDAQKWREIAKERRR
jgi:hypothetical protein